MAKKMRIGAVILALMVLFAMLSSMCFIATESEHDCAGEDCPICCQISICRNVLKTIGYAAAFSAGVIVLSRFVAAVRSLFIRVNDSTTLVSLKVNLSN